MHCIVDPTRARATREKSGQEPEPAGVDLLSSLVYLYFFPLRHTQGLASGFYTSFISCVRSLFLLISSRMSTTDDSADLPEGQLQHNSTLFVDKSVSLSLGSDSLLIVGMISCKGWMRDFSLLSRAADDHSVRKRNRRCCGLCKSSKRRPSLFAVLAIRLQSPSRSQRLFCIHMTDYSRVCRKDQEHASHFVVQCA